MKRISGYVLVKETNVGIPNLLVAAYDFDKRLDVTIARDGPSAQLSREQGRRIGSVLTNQDGSFVLTSEDLEFQGNESRPDLVLIVFAPEDILSPDQPSPLPPERRILYISAVSRSEAGAEEAFVIRLLQAQLEKFQISAGAVSDGNHLASAIGSSWTLRDTVREKLKPRVQEEYSKAERFRKLAHKHVQHLSAIPRYLRDDANGTNPLRNNRFLIKEEDLTRLGAIQDAILADGLDRLASHRPRVTLRLTKKDLADLGLELRNNDLTGEVNSEKLMEKVHALMQGVDFVRVRGLNNLSPDELERKYLLDQ